MADNINGYQSLYNTSSVDVAEIDSASIDDLTINNTLTMVPFVGDTDKIIKCNALGQLETSNATYSNSTDILTTPNINLSGLTLEEDELISQDSVNSKMKRTEIIARVINQFNVYYDLIITDNSNGIISDKFGRSASNNYNNLVIGTKTCSNVVISKESLRNTILGNTILYQFVNTAINRFNTFCGDGILSSITSKDLNSCTLIGCQIDNSTDNGLLYCTAIGAMCDFQHTGQIDRSFIIGGSCTSIGNRNVLLGTFSYNFTGSNSIVIGDGTYQTSLYIPMFSGVLNNGRLLMANADGTITADNAVYYDSGTTTLNAPNFSGSFKLSGLTQDEILLYDVANDEIAGAGMIGKYDSIRDLMVITDKLNTAIDSAYGTKSIIIGMGSCTNSTTSGAYFTENTIIGHDVLRDTGLTTAKLNSILGYNVFSNSIDVQECNVVGHDVRSGNIIKFACVLGNDNLIFDTSTGTNQKTILLGTNCTLDGSNNILIGDNQNIIRANSIQLGTDTHTTLYIPRFGASSLYGLLYVSNDGEIITDATNLNYNSGVLSTTSANLTANLPEAQNYLLYKDKTTGQITTSTAYDSSGTIHMTALNTNLINTTGLQITAGGLTLSAYAGVAGLIPFFDINGLISTDSFFKYIDASNRLEVANVRLSSLATANAIVYTNGSGDLTNSSGLTFNSGSNTLTTTNIYCTYITATALDTTPIKAVLFSGTGGIIGNDVNFYFDDLNDILTTPSIELSGMSAGRVVYTGILGLLESESGFEYNSTTNTLSSDYVSCISATSSSINITSGNVHGVVYEGSGTLATEAGFTYDDSTNNLSVPSIKLSGMSAGRVVYTGTGGLLESEAGFEYNSTTNTLSASNISSTNSNVSSINITSGNVHGVVYEGSGTLATEAGFTYDDSTNNLSVPDATITNLSGHANEHVIVDANGKLQVSGSTLFNPCFGGIYRHGASDTQTSNLNNSVQLYYTNASNTTCKSTGISIDVGYYAGFQLVENNGSGKARFRYIGGSLPQYKPVSISGTTNYDGTYLMMATGLIGLGVFYFDIDVAYVAETMTGKYFKTGTELIISDTGCYEIMATICYGVSIANSQVEWDIYSCDKSGYSLTTSGECGAIMKSTTATDIREVVISGLLTINNANDSFVIAWNNNTLNSNLTIRDMNFKAVKISDL